MEEQQRQKEALVREKERLARLFRENEELLARKAMLKKQDADEIMYVRTHLSLCVQCASYFDAEPSREKG